MAKKKLSPEHFLKVAKKHLQKVQDAWEEPDWDDLTTYGLYCLEALVRAAVIKVGGMPKSTHWGKVEEARELTKNHGLTDIEDLMKNLNDGRKANAYGDEEFDESEYDAEELAESIEAYFDEISKFVKKPTTQS